ncbi:MAG: DUF3828 domain-containing protein [Bacteroidetes bacterium]|nr:DUF3828 domain-containing protein [Bacteroidota bacterium]
MKNSILFSAILMGILAWNACNNAGKTTETANAWVVVDNQGGITLFGRQVQDFEDFQASLYDTLTKMENLPDSIPVHFGEEILMGTRGEIRTIIAESIATAAARKESEAVIHGFYTWYGTFSQTEEAEFNFLDDKGQHLKLDLVKLEAYLGRIKASGFVGNAFIEGRKAFYKNCEKLWQNEPKDEPPSCLDHDPYFCAQDWELDFWTKSPVFIDLAGERVSATMRGTEGGSPQEHDFELVQENGKWVLAKIACGSE